MTSDQPIETSQQPVEYELPPEIYRVLEEKWYSSTGNVAFDGCKGIDSAVMQLFIDRFPAADIKTGATLFEAMSISLAGNSGRFGNLKLMRD